MTRPTKIVFKNYTKKPITISPIKSSFGRWDAFTLQPNQFKSIKDSNGGTGNYDIEWSVKVNPIGIKNDVLTGQFRADNPFTFWGLMYEAYVSAQEESKSIFFAYRDENLTPPWSYKDNSWVYNNSFASDGTARFGKADVNKLTPMDAYSEPGWYYTSDADIYAPFDKTVPFADVSPVADISGAKTWWFVMQEWGK